MYNNLLNHVVSTIKQTTKPTANDKLDIMFYQMFNPEGAEKMATSARKKEELGQKLILIATGAAVAGEVIHLAKRSGIIKKILKT